MQITTLLAHVLLLLVAMYPAYVSGQCHPDCGDQNPNEYILGCEQVEENLINRIGIEEL